MSGLSLLKSATGKMVMIFITVGGVALLLLETLQSRFQNEVLLSHVLTTMDQGAKRDRVQLDQIIKGFHQSVQVITHNKGFVDYVERVADSQWSKEQPVHVTLHRHPPAWFPANSVIRSFLPTRHAILLDGENRVRELYQHLRQTPSALLPPSPLLLQLSRGDTFMTYLDEGIPYLLTSDTIRRRSGRLLATVVFATPMDDQFLASLQAKRPKDGSILALFDSQENPVVLTSSDVSAVPAGETLEGLRKKYHVTDLDMFDYGSSDLLIQFASLNSRKEALATVAGLAQRERLLRLSFGGGLLLVLTLVVTGLLWRTRQTHDRLTARLAEVAGAGEQDSEGATVLEDQVDRLLELVKTADQLLQEKSGEAESHHALLQTVLRQVEDGVIVVDEKGMVESINPGAEKIFGWTKEEMVGHSLRRMMGDQLWERHHHALAQFTPSGYSHVVNGHIEVTALRADGSSFPLDLKVFYLELARGKRFVGVVRDLTRQKQLALSASLRESEQSFRDVLERANMAVLLLDKEGHIVFCNDYLLTLTGFNRQELLGTLWWHHLLPADQHLMVQKFFHHVATLSDGAFLHHGFESLILLKGGENRLFSWNVLLLRDENDQLTQQAMLGSDLTWLRKIEQEMSQAREETLQAHRQKSHYLARLNHEIRSPLNAIIGFVDILNHYRHQLPSDLADYLTYITRSSRDLLELLNNVLDYARLEEGRLGVVMEEVNPRLLVQGAYHLHLPEAGQKSLNYTYHVDESLPATMYSDRTLLNRILLGLLVVVLHGAPRGGKVHLLARREANWLCLEVADNGPSLPPGGGEGLYQALSQNTPPEAQRFFHAPMALPLVKKAVDKLQGHLSHHNLPQRGVAFVARVPCLEVPRLDAPLVPFEDGQSVLLVVEDAAYGHMLAATCRQMGLEPLVTRTMAEAVALPRLERVQLVILDQSQEPRQGGLEQRPALWLGEEEISHLPPGVIGCLGKPLDRSRLHALLAQVLTIAAEEEDSLPLPELSDGCVEEITNLLDELTAQPLYRAETIVRLSRKIKHRCQDYRTTLPSLCDAIVEAVHGRNINRVPQLILEARTLLETEYGHHPDH